MTQFAPTTPSPGLRIRRLPALLVNQIAAGEVIERPASLVKELIDNAIDAGAARIAVELEQGGIELVRVTDDGTGIAADDLPLAVAPHATSKIAAAEDLDRIGTMGFRGEALASIASVSRLSIRSRTRDAEGASLLEAEGATTGEVQPAAGPVGTSVTVRNLFFNTPARRKFLRTVGTEQGHCLEMARELAMSHPGISFAATCDGRPIFDLGAGQTAPERVLAVLGKELREQLVEVGVDEFADIAATGGVLVWGMAGLPVLARVTAKVQHIYLNGRPIRDKTIQHALREAYRGLIEPGRYPTAVLMLEMDPVSVDVNVHPTKSEVRFRDSSLVHSVVLRAVRDALRRADLTPSVGSPGFGGPSGAGGSGGAAIGRGGVGGGGAFVEYFTRPVSAQPDGRFGFGAIREAIERGATDEHGSTQVGEGAAGGDAGIAGPVEMAVPRPAERALQVHNSYVVTEDEQGLVIVDQHALHERAMFEMLLERVARAGVGDGAAGLESQRMLVPVVVPATARQIEKLSELAPLLARIGMAVEPMGPTTVGVQAFPTFLFDRNVDAGEFVRELLERTDDAGFVPGGEEALHEVLDMMACKAAIKAGDHMSDGELRDLLRMREAVERSSNCPHGRPTSIRVTIKELERRFGRT